MEKFKHEERFLELITEKTGELYSITELSDGHGLTSRTLMDKPKFTPYFLEGTNYVDGTHYLDSIFVFDQDKISNFANQWFTLFLASCLVSPRRQAIKTNISLTHIPL